MPKKKEGSKKKYSKTQDEKYAGQRASKVTQATGLYSNSEMRGSSPRYHGAVTRSRGADMGALRTKETTTPVIAGGTRSSHTSTSPSVASSNQGGSRTTPKINKKLGAKYASVLEDAKRAVDGKTMNAAERKKVRDARAKLKKMRKKLVLS